MPSGKTLDMIALCNSFQYYPSPEVYVTERDRSLNGKARVKARKAARRAAK